MIYRSTVRELVYFTVTSTYFPYERGKAKNQACWCLYYRSPCLAPVLLGVYAEGMEAKNEHERYVKNPLRLLRALAEFAMRPPTDLPHHPFSDYPVLGPAEAPVATEEELIL
jgi:hypothetical protein